MSVGPAITWESFCAKACGTQSETPIASPPHRDTKPTPPTEPEGRAKPINLKVKSQWLPWSRPKRSNRRRKPSVF